MEKQTDRGTREDKKRDKKSGLRRKKQNEKDKNKNPSEA